MKFCPICGDILYKTQITVGGMTDWYWVCPAGDWEDPVIDQVVIETQEETEEQE